MVNLEFNGQIEKFELVGLNGANVTLKTGKFENNKLKGYVSDKNIFAGTKNGQNITVKGYIQTNEKGFTNFIIKEIVK